MVGTNSMTSLVNLTCLKLLIAKDIRSRLLTVLPSGKLMPFRLTFSRVDLPFAVNGYRRMSWSLRSAADDSRLNSGDDSSGGTRLIRTIRAIQLRIIARLNELRKDLPVKLFSFLVGFYCATAFATVIGQTGDWDVLSAAVAVAVVEGIGALMYKASLPLVDNSLVIYAFENLNKKISDKAWSESKMTSRVRFICDTPESRTSLSALLVKWLTKIEPT